mmetsp:Transcript_16167/g.38430  ORF Transcript_16167/g.38430 Transcript_16167/m.38430 type:complete len:211 (-) Transcript_16167:282-914(-)
MQEGLGLDRLVDAHHAAEELVVGRHHGELHEGVGGELVLDDAHLAEASEVEGAGLILVHQVGEPHLCEADGLLELRGEAPADVVRRGVGRQLVGLAEGARAAHVGPGGAPLEGAQAGDIRDLGGEAHDGGGEEVGDETEHRVPVDRGVLEVNPCRAIGAHNDLHLVVPSVGHRAHLHAVAVHRIRAVQHGARHGRGRGRGVVVEAKHEEC